MISFCRRWLLAIRALQVILSVLNLFFRGCQCLAHGLPKSLADSKLDEFRVADITSIRLQSEFVYLAVILDGHFRKVVGRKLDRTLTSRLAIDALWQAIGLRCPLPGLVQDDPLVMMRGRWIGLAVAGC